MNLIKLPAKLVIFLSLFILSFLLYNPLPALAHRPHDVISQLEISPNYSQDRTLYIIVREQFLKSTDGGKSWSRVVNGIDNKNYFSSLTLSHQNSQVLFLSSLGDGIYKTENSGNSWYKVNNGFTNLRIDKLLISPLSDEIVLASGDNILYQTLDGGKNWQYTTQAAASIAAIAFSPTQKDIFLIGDGQGNVYSSLDGGLSWRQIAALPNRDPVNTPTGNKITALAVLPDGSVFIGTSHQGIYRTTLQGESIQEVNQGLLDLKVVDIAISPNYQQDSLIFASTWDEGTLRSSDGGKSWQVFSRGLTKDLQADVPQFSEPHFRMIRLSPDFSEDTTMYLAGFNGLFQTTDGGKQWHELETLSTRAIVALAVSPNHAKDGTLAFGTYEQEAYISHNRGGSWRSMLNGLAVLKHQPGDPNEWQIEPPRFYALSFSPNFAVDKTLFATLLYKFSHTTDSGQSWNRTPFPAVAEANNRDVLMAVSPNYAEDRIVYTAAKYGGLIYRSKDGGKKFAAIGEVGDSITSLAISANFAADGTLFATTFKEGVHRSTDGGRSWKNVTENPSLSNYRWLTMAISPNYQADGTVWAGTDRGIVVSDDGGATWTHLETTPYQKDSLIEAIAISPDYQNDRTYIVGVRGHGLWKTSDGGRTFQQIGRDLIQKNYPFTHMVMSASAPIQFSPTYAQDRTLYGFGSAKAEIYRSTDAGETWDVLFIPRQFDFKAALFDHLKLIKLFFRVYPGLKIVASVVGALLAYLLLGLLKLEKRLPLKRWQLRICGSALAFITLWLLLSD